MQTITKRTTVDIDTRRTVVMAARSRSKNDVAKVPHEAFVRQLLKAKMGWAKNEPAPEHIKQVARQVAEQLRSAELANSKRIIASNEAASAAEGVQADRLRAMV